MKRKAESSFHREDFLQNEQVNSRLSHSYNSLNGGNIFPRRTQRTGRGLLFESAMKRFEEVGKNAWEIQMSTSPLPLSEIEKRRIVRLKLPSEILKERSDRIIEEPPKNMNLGESFVSANQQHLDSTSAKEINTSAASFSFSRFIAPTPIHQVEQLEKSNQNELSSIQSEHTAFPQGSQSLMQSQEITSLNQSAEDNQITSNVSSQEKKDQVQSQESVINKPVSIFGGNSSLLKQTERGPSTGLFGQAAASTGGLFSSGIGAKPTTQETPVTATSVFSGDSSQAKQSTGMFGQTSGGGLFANSNVPKPAQENVTVQKPLFGNEASQLRPVSGLFGSGSASALPGSSLIGTSLPQKEAVQETPEIKKIEQEQPKTGLFSNNITTKPSEGPFASKPEEKKEVPKGGLFANTPGLSSAGGLFGANAKTEQTKDEPKSGLLGTTFGSQPSSLLPSANKPEEKKEEQKGGLFANASAPKSEGLFANTVEQKKEEPKGGLFGNLTSSTKPSESVSSNVVEEEKDNSKGLFVRHTPANQSAGLFAPPQKKEEPKNGGLFGSYLAQKSAENISTKPEEKKEEPKGGLFGNRTSFTKPSETVEQKKEEPKGGLFSNLPSSTKLSQSSPSNSIEEEEEKPKTNLPTTGLFAHPDSEVGKKWEKGELPMTNIPSKPTSSLFAPSSLKKEEPKTGGLFGNYLAKQSGENIPTKPEEKKEEPKGGLFADASALKSGGLFANPVEQKKEEPKGGLFGNRTSSTKLSESISSNAIEEEKPKGLMVNAPPNTSGNLFAPKKTEEKKEEQKGGLFANTSAPKSGGLFANTVEQKKEEPKGGLFANTSPSKPSGLFAGSAEPKKEEPKGGLFGNTSTPKSEGMFTSTVEQKKEEPKGGLFANTSPSKPSGLFGSNKSEEMKEEVKPTPPATTETNTPKGGLFASMMSQKSFGSTPTQNKDEKEAAKPEPKKEEKSAATGPVLPKAGFFSNLAPSTPSGNMFSPEKSKGEKEEPKKTGLFGSAVASSGTGLFGSSGQTQAQSQTTPAPNLFSKDHKSTLFADKPSGNFSSIFGPGPSAPAQSGSMFGKPKEDEDGGSGDEDEGDDEPERSPSPEADVTKSKGNYQYQQNYDKIASQKLNKFKPGVKSLLPEGEVSLNKMNESVYFLIYRNKAKVIQYQGQLIKKVSVTKYLNERHDAMSVVAFSEDKSESKDKGSKLSKDELKMMFPTSEQCDEFKKAIDNVLN